MSPRRTAAEPQLLLIGRVLTCLSVVPGTVLISQGDDGHDRGMMGNGATVLLCRSN